MTASCAAFRTASPPASSTTSARCWNRPDSATPPGTWDELLKAALAVNKPPDRYGFGTMGLQGAGLYSGYAPWLYSNGGRLLDFKTGEIYINEPKAVEALQFYGDLNTKHKVVPPEAMTWAFDDIVAGGQSDRYAMTQMFAPYGTLINDPKISRTGGKWAWSTVQGPHSKEEGRTWIDGHFLGVPKFTKNKEWALEFIAMCCSREWQKRAMIRGNAPPLRSVLEDPEMVERIGWPPVAAQAIETGFPTPGHPVWDTLDIQLRSAISQTMNGQKTAKQALDETAIGLAAQPAACGDRPMIRRRHLLRRNGRRCGAAEVRAGAGQARQAGVRRRQRTVALVPGRGGRAGVREAARHQGRFHPAADRRAERAAEGGAELRLRRHRHHPVDRALCRLAGAAHGGP